MNRELFLFIAKEIEHIGQPKGDKGGNTIYGITEVYHPAYYNVLKKAIDSNKPRYFIEGIIIEAYTNIYNKTRAKDMPIPLNAHYFDMSFNMGEDDAIKVLQKALNEYHRDDPHLKDDGIWGKHTRDSYNDAPRRKHLARLYAIERRKHYIRHTDREVTCGLEDRCNKLELFLELNAWY